MAATYLMGQGQGQEGRRGMGNGPASSLPSTPLGPPSASAYPPPPGLPWLSEWRVRRAVALNQIQSLAVALATTSATLYSL